MPLAARVAHARLLLERWNFLARFPAKKWLILVDLRARILMEVVSTAVDGWRGRIVGLKLRWPTKIVPFFRPDGEAKTLKTAGNGRSDERENCRQEERETPRFATVWTRAWCTGASKGCEPLDCGWTDPAAVIGWICKLSTVRMGWGVIWCGAVYRELGTLGDVAQQDLRANCFKGWDVFGF